MRDGPRPLRTQDRWQPVGDVMPVFMGLIRASASQLAVIWAIMTAGVLAINLTFEALGFETLPGILGVTPAILPITFGTAMAAHRLLWPHAPTLGECADVAFRAFPALLAVLAIRQALMTIGFSFLFVPGLAVIVFIFLAPVLVLAERLPLKETLTRSALMVLPKGWAILALVLISAFSSLLAVIPLGVISMPLGAFGDGVVETVVIAGAMVSFPLGFITMGVAIYLYLTGATETRH